MFYANDVICICIFVFVKLYISIIQITVIKYYPLYTFVVVFDIFLSRLRGSCIFRPVPDRDEEPSPQVKKKKKKKKK